MFSHVKTVFLKQKNVILFVFHIKSSILANLFIVSYFNLSTSWEYFSVRFNPLCPNKLGKIFTLVPLLKTFTAKLCRTPCQLICLLLSVLSFKRSELRQDNKTDEMQQENERRTGVNARYKIKEIKT